MLDAGRRLVSLVRGLGEQLHDDRRDCARDRFAALGGRHGLSCDVAVHPLERLGSREGQTAGQQFVQGDAERIEVAAGIDGPIHAAGLFGGYVSKGARDDSRRLGCLALPRQA